jgi:hypothetical protein
MTERRIDGFFYGLFMDVDLLRNSGVAPERVNGFETHLFMSLASNWM